MFSKAILAYNFIDNPLGFGNKLRRSLSMEAVDLLGF